MNLQKLSKSTGTEDQNASWMLVVCLVTWLAILLFSCHRYSAPTPTESGEFSTESALAFLQPFVGHDLPHPSGSEQNRLVRQQLVSQFESLGYEVEIQSGEQAVPEIARKLKRTDQPSVELHNVIAIRRGTGNGKAIALTTHYDSTPFGPGASDDGVGVAVTLEIARLFAAKKPPQRDVVFLVTDGEELGLLGAKLFVESHALADQIGLVINLEARGTSGPSLMFETSPQSRKLIPAFVSCPGKKMTSSLFREIYDRLPNDTDFTVYRTHGMAGYNFAFIGDVRNYHTPADSLSNVQASSLYHHGQNALGLMDQILSSRDMDSIIDAERQGWRDKVIHEEATYFDFFGYFIIWWPASWSFFAVLLVVILFMTGEAMPGGNPSNSQTTATVVRRSPVIVFMITVIPLLILVPAGMLFCSLVRSFDPFTHPWPARPVALFTCFWAATLASVSGWAILIQKHLNPKDVALGIHFLWICLGFAVSLFLPGASHLFVIPLLGGAMARLTCSLFRGKTGSEYFSSACFAILVGLMWLPLERLFYDAVGFKMSALLFFRAVLVSTTLLPLFTNMSSNKCFLFSMAMASVAVLSLLAGRMS